MDADIDEPLLPAMKQTKVRGSADSEQVGSEEYALRGARLFE
jgi:hypothetical protein